MIRMATFVAVGAAVVALTQPVHAQSVDEHGSGSSADSVPAVEVRNGSEWAATDDSMRPQVGSAILRPRLVLPDTYGTWAHPLVGFATTTPVALFAGELALSSRWSAVFEGARDSLDRFSGGAVGLRLHLTPRQSPIQLSLSGGAMRDLSGAMRDLIGGSGFWSQINVSHAVGRWRFAGVLRAHGLAGDAQTWLTGSGGVSYDLGQVRVGVEYAVEQSKVVARSAVMAWVAMPIAKGLSQLRLTGVIPTSGNDGASLRLAFVSDF